MTVPVTTKDENNGPRNCSRKLSPAWLANWWRPSIRTPKPIRLLCSFSS